MGLVNGEANMISSLITSMGGESGAISWTRRVLELLPIESRYSLARTCKWMYNCAVESNLPIFHCIDLDTAASTMSFEMVQFLHCENLLIPGMLYGGIVPGLRHGSAGLGKWMVDNVLASETDVFNWATYCDSMDLVNYAIEHNWDKNFNVTDLNLSMRMLERLYTRKHIWKEFKLSEIEDICTEDVFLFLLKHQSDPMLCLSEALEDGIFQRIFLRRLDLVQDMTAVRRLLAIWIFSADREKLQQGTCKSMEPRIRAHIASKYCECNDPFRHEYLRDERARKRAKF
jgi:hypothetical protein